MVDQIMPSLKSAFIEDLTNAAYEVGLDYSEIALDAIVENEAFKEIPVVKTVLAVYKVGVAIKDRQFIKKLAIFMSEAQQSSVPSKEFEAFKTKFCNDEKYANYVVEHLFIMLDRTAETMKSRLLAKLFTAYIKGKCSLEQFVEMSSCLDMLLLSDCDVLRDIFKKSQQLSPDSDGLIKFDAETGSIIIGSISRLRATGLISGDNRARFGGEGKIPVIADSIITQFGVKFASLALD